MRKALGRRDRGGVAAAGTGDPTPDPDADTRERGGRRLTRGLHGSLDAPQGVVVAPGAITVGGWVFHDSLDVTHVVVTVDDLPVGLAVVKDPRPDVLAAHPEHRAAAQAGWTVEIPAWGVRASEVRVGAHALVASEGPGRQRLGTLVRFAESVLQVQQNPAEFGAVTPLGPVSPGFVEVSGTAWHPAGLSRVEVSTAGSDLVRARHSLPGRVAGVLEHDERDLAGFSAFVRLPAGAASVRLDATVTGADGTRVNLEPVEVPVVAHAAADGVSAARTEILDRRLTHQTDVLRRAAQADPPRILVATHDLGIGGAQLYLHLLLRGLRERGIEMCLVSGAGGVLLDDLEQELAIPVLVVGQASAGREQLEAQRLQIASFAAAHHVVGCLANTLLAFPAVSAVQSMGLPSVWAIHESFDPASFWRQYFGYQLPGAIADVALDALARCNDVVFEAESTRQLYSSMVTEGRSAVVPYGVDTAAIDAFRATHTQAQVRVSLSLPADARVLVCVGTVEPRKGQLALARAFGRLDEELRTEVVLAFVGAGQDAYSDALREHVSSAGLAGARVVDVDTDVHRWYLAADVLVSASDIESVPRTMLEAMAMGRPVAATDVFGVGEVVIEGETGFTCEALDLEALTDLLRRAITAPPREVERLGRAARELILRRHDPAAYTAHYAERLNEWLSGKGL